MSATAMPLDNARPLRNLLSILPQQHRSDEAARCIAIASCSSEPCAQHFVLGLLQSATTLPHQPTLFITANHPVESAEGTDTPTLFDVIRDEADVQDSIAASSSSHVSTIVLGSVPATHVPNLAERVAQAFDVLRQKFDIVVVELPADADFSLLQTVVPVVDDVILAVSATGVRASAARKIKRTLEKAGTQRISIVTLRPTTRSDETSRAAYPSRSAVTRPRDTSSNREQTRRFTELVGSMRTGPPYGVEPFALLIRKERMRSDRNGHPYSLIEFTMEANAANVDGYRKLVAILAERLRLIDEIGWLGANRLGVLLPGTAAEGAVTIANEIGERFEHGQQTIHHRVLSYPSPDLPQDPASGHTRAPNMHLSDDGHGNTTEPLEPLFMRPVPAWKRGIDVIGSTALMVVLSPLLIVVAVAIKLQSRGPILFTQMRRGHGGDPFRMYKFRSMVVGADAQKQDLSELNEQDGPAFKIEKDPRTTKLGRFLRRSSIDELPQLWNVLKGEMTLVGPRPLPCEEADNCELWQKRRLDVIPGLTCIWQIRGRSCVSFARWVRMDMEYLDRYSLLTDIKILLATLPAVLLPPRRKRQ